MTLSIGLALGIETTTSLYTHSRSSSDCAYPAAVKAVELQDITGVVLFHLPKNCYLHQILGFYYFPKTAELKHHQFEKAFIDILSLVKILTSTFVISKMRSFLSVQPRLNLAHLCIFLEHVSFQ